MSNITIEGGDIRPVDLVHLSRQTMGDRDLEREVLALFEHQSLAILARLREASNAKSWSEAAHTLKGSARGIGAFEVAKLAEELELVADDYLSCEAWTSLKKLEGCVSETNSYIAELAA
jgi:HPt (histidine-containing phosphotransfer) domain-containing protein